MVYDGGLRVLFVARNWQELLKRENVVWAKPLTRVGAKVHRGKGSIFWVWHDCSRVRNLQTYVEGWEILHGWCSMMQFSSWQCFDVWSLFIRLYKTEHHVVLVGSRPRRWTSHMVVRVSGVCGVPCVLHWRKLCWHPHLFWIPPTCCLFSCFSN